ncbi:MAG: DUF885 domain-containing protein [Gemmatimonadetes bacterium]|nr:DUF885 domain-containing protein [Gemmatimonadota bacterium]
MPVNKFFITATLLCALSCAGPDVDVIANDVSAVADDYVAAYFDAFPHQSTLGGLTNAIHDRLPDNSTSALARWRATEDSLLARLTALDGTALEGRPQAITYGFLRFLLEASVAYRSCKIELWNVSPTWTGWQAEFAALASIQPTATAEDRAAALRRFGELPRYIRTEIANLRLGVRMGYSAPKNNVRAVVEQMNGLLAAPLSSSPFTSMADEGMDDFRADLEQLVHDHIRPAIAEYRSFLQIEYLAAAREAIGVSANPNGAECYRAAVRYHATIDISPEQVHQTGLDQMETILAQMREIGARSFGTTDTKELLERLRSEPQYLFRTRRQMIEYAEAAVARAKAEIPNWFGMVPSAPVIVEPYPAFQEKSAPGGQAVAPAEDGSRPGKYLINTYQPERQPIAGLESTAFHETYPGHHLQISIAMENKELHPVGRYFFLSGFGEGWGLYSERLADEMGLFTTDVDRMGLLSAEAHRAARLVVDAGMHVLGWKRQQALDYLLEHTALSEALATAEIDRFLAVPGQATAYMLGNMEIRRLRELAERELGDEFDIKEFHDRVLEDGSVPLIMLREKIERWLEQ